MPRGLQRSLLFESPLIRRMDGTEARGRHMLHTHPSRPSSSSSWATQKQYAWPKGSIPMFRWSWKSMHLLDARPSCLGSRPFCFLRWITWSKFLWRRAYAIFRTAVWVRAMRIDHLMPRQARLSWELSTIPSAARKDELFFFLRGESSSIYCCVKKANLRWWARVICAADFALRTKHIAHTPGDTGSTGRVIFGRSREFIFLLVRHDHAETLAKAVAGLRRIYPRRRLSVFEGCYRQAAVVAPGC